MFSKIRRCISHILGIFKKNEYYPYGSAMDSSFLTDSPCNFTNVDSRKISTQYWHYGDDEYHKFSFKASIEEYNCLKNHINGLSPEEIWNLDDNSEEKEDLLWLITPAESKEWNINNESEKEEEIEIITEDNIHKLCIEFICEDIRDNFTTCNESSQICFTKTSEINCYTFMCFSHGKICHFSFCS